MVVEVTADEISTKERETGKIVSEPYGMVVWSTGIGIRPVIKDFMQQIGQVRLRFLTSRLAKIICSCPQSNLRDCCVLSMNTGAEACLGNRRMA